MCKNVAPCSLGKQLEHRWQMGGAAEASPVGTGRVGMSCVGPQAVEARVPRAGQPPLAAAGSCQVCSGPCVLGRCGSHQLAPCLGFKWHSALPGCPVTQEADRRTTSTLLVCLARTQAALGQAVLVDVAMDPGARGTAGAAVGTEMTGHSAGNKVQLPCRGTRGSAAMCSWPALPALPTEATGAPCAL